MSAARVAAAVLVLSAVRAPGPAAAWGTAGHRLVAKRAAAALPAGTLGEFARAHRETIADRSLDPDLIWREECGLAEAITHFFDADLYGPDPAAIPRDERELRAKHGHRHVTDAGLLPWKIEEMAGCLVRALRTGDEVWARDLMGQLAHYTGDLANPFHLTSDHDGQSTGQRGIHHRYEDGLVDARRYTLARRVDRTPVAASPRPPLEVAFGAIDDVAGRVGRVLAADRAAAARETLDSREYYELLARELETTVVEDLARGARMTAEVWLWAWEEAGRPQLGTLPAPAPRPQSTRQRTNKRR